MFNRIEMLVSGVLVTVTTFVSNVVSHVTNVVHQLLNEVHTVVTGLVGHFSVFSGGAHTPASGTVAEALRAAATAKVTPAPAPAPVAPAQPE